MCSNEQSKTENIVVMINKAVLYPDPVEQTSLIQTEWQIE